MIEDYPRTLMELERRFGDEDRCRDYLYALRWPGGFVCPRCGGREAWRTTRGLWLCRACRMQVSVMAGTVFQDSKVPLTVWFRAMWQVTSQQHGISALGLQRVMGLGSYRTAWAMLHKLRRAMVRPGREQLRGAIEVDETYWGAPEEGASGRRTLTKALLAIAAEAVPGTDRAIGRVRLARIPDVTRASLHGFIRESIEPGSTVITDGLRAYRSLRGYHHQRRVQVSQDAGEEHLLPRVHRVAS